MPDVRPNATAHRSGAAHRPASGFELRLDRGGAHVHLAPSPPGSGLAVEALDLEVPDVRMPIDVGAGPSQFQNRLCDLCKLAVRLEPAFLAAAAGRVDRAALGLDGLEVALQDGFVEVGGTLRGGPAFALRIALVQGVERGVQAVPYAARVFGPSAVPAAALAAQAARALLALGVPEDPLPALLRKLLVARGWKAPREKAVRLSALSVSPVGIKLAWDRQPAAPISPPVDPALLAALEGARAFEAAEQLLADGDYAGAREALLGDPAAASHPFAAERVLSLLCLEERFHDEALDLAADWLARRPGFAPALAAEAWIRLARGEQERAAAALVGLAEEAVAGNERIAAAAAAEAALALPGASRATRQRAVDAALAVKRDHLPAIRAQHALAKEIGDRGGQLRAVRRLLAYAPGDAEKARAHAELGELLLEKDPPAARLHLDRALRLDPGDPESMATLARACLAAGEHLRAVRALDRLRELKLQAGDKAEAARLALQTGAIWESPLGHLENAWLRYREAADLGPGGAEAHRLAAACAARLGRWADAADHHAAALAMVDASTLQGAAAAAAHHLALAEVAELHLDDPAGAAGHLEAATALVSPDAALLARLASLYRRLDRPAELAAALERLAPLGPDPVERAALLAEAGDLLRQKLGRDEAAQARYAAALGHEPACRRALAGMAAVASARGDAAAERDALQRLLAISADKGEQATLLDRLASACERSGDLPAASRAVASARRLAPTRARLAAAVALARSAGDRHSLSGLLDELGRLAAADGDPAGGAAAFRERCDLLEPDDLPLAMAALGEARRLLPGDTTLLRREAALAARAGDHQLALGALKALLEGEPVDAPALELTAACTALAAGQITEACAHAQRAFVAGATGAVEVLDEALTRNGDESGRAGLLSRLGRHLEAAALHEHLGDLSAAVGALEAAAAVPSTAVEALRHLIRLRAQRGDAPGTALALVAAARLSGGREGAELALRAFHLATSDEALDVAVAADPAFAPARAERARRRAGHDPSGALTDAEAALAGLELDPVRRPELLRLAAQLALDAGDQELGRRRLAAFCQVGVPDDAELARLADLQRAAGDDEGLVNALERRLPLAPPELALPLRLELATLLSRQGRDQEAVARWRQALSLDRQALPALRALLDAARAGALVDGERTALLTLLARHADADAPSRAAAWDELAAQREAARDLRGAMEAVAEAARLRGEQDQILRRHADLATRMGDRAVAAAAWDELAAQREAARDLRGAMEAVAEAARLRGEEDQILRRHADLATRLGDQAVAAGAWDELAAQREAARDLRGAMEAVAEAARLRGEQDQILRRHADLATRLGDQAVAAAAWDELAAQREATRDLRGAMEAVAEAAALRGEQDQILRRHADLATRLGDQAVAAAAWDGLAARREAARDLRGAMEAVAEAARLRGEEDEVLERHAELATRLGDQGVAATALLARARRGLERSEAGAPARLVESGLAALAAGLEADGVAALEQALGLAPGAEPLRAARTALLERAARLGDRAGEALQLAALVPLLPTGERPGQLLRLSDLRASLGDPSGALAAAEEARALAPRDLQTVHRTRLAAEAGGADQRVAELLAEEAELDPSLAGPLLLDRARRLLALGQAEAADDAFLEAQRHLDADLAVASEQSRLRRTHPIGRSAADPLERCAKRTADPGAAARIFLAAAALALQEDDRGTALRCARRAHSRRRDAPAEAGPLLARLLYEQGAFAEALVLHRTLLESGFAGLEDADVVALCRQLAELAAEAGERSLALQALDRLLALRPQEAEAARLRFALDPDRAHAVSALAEIAGRQASEATRGALLGEAAQAALGELRDRSLGERLFREARTQAARVAGAPLALVRRRVEVTRAADLGPEALLSALQEAAEATGDAGLTGEARTFLEEAVREERGRGMWAAAARDLAQLEALHATEGDFRAAAERARQAGELLAEAGELPAALEALERAAEAEPEHRATLERIAELGRTLGGEGGGSLVGALERLAALTPAGAPRVAALLRQAEAEEAVLHDVARAEASLRAALAEAPGHPGAEAALQALLERTGRGGDLARRLLDQARTDADAAGRTALRRRAVDLLGRSTERADLDLAADAAVAVALDAPSDLRAARDAAAALQAAGRPTEAIPHHALVARAEPGDETAVAALLEAYAARPRDRAELHLARAAASQGATRAARLREAAHAFTEAGETRRADQSMEQAFQAWPADEAAFAGAVSAAGDDLDRLDAVLRTRAEAVPAEAGGCHRARADMLFTMGRLERAAEAFEAALATDPEDAAGLATLGACLVSLHGPEAARHTDRRLAALAEARPGRVPASLEAEARYRLGLHAAPGTAAGSIRTDLERALWLAPEDPRADRAFEALAEAHLGLDDLPGALSAVRARAERAAARGDEAAELAALERGEVLLTDRPDPSADGAALLDALLVRRTAGSFAAAEVEPLARRVAEAWRALDQESRARQALTRAGLPPVELPTHLVAVPSEPATELEILEPVAAQPAFAEPVAVEPVAVEPADVEPVAIEPVAVEPVAVEPVAVEPADVEPADVEPVAVEPVAVEPVAVEPVAVEPVAELAVESPEALEPLPRTVEEPPVELAIEAAIPAFVLEPSPATTELAATEDEASGLYGGLPGAPHELFAVADEAGDLTAELPFQGPPSNAAAEEASELAAALGAAEPSLDLAQADEAVAAEPPAPPEPVSVEPVAVEPVAVEPVAVEPVGVEPVAVEPVPVEPVAVEPVAVEPVAVEPVETAPEDSAFAEPALEEPTFDEPAAVEPFAAPPAAPVSISLPAPELESSPEESAYAEPVQEEAAFDEPEAAFEPLTAVESPAPMERPGVILLDAGPSFGTAAEFAAPIAVEPVALEPVAAEPVAAEPVAVEPVAVEPVAVEPVAVEPVAAEPVAVEPVAVEPVAVEPVAVEPVAVESVAVEPAAIEPVAVEPVAVEPVAVEPEPLAEPTLAESDFSEPYFTETDFTAPTPAEPLAPAPPDEPIPAAIDEGELAFSLDDRPAPEERPAPVEAVEIAETEDEAARRDAEGHARVAEATLDARDRALAWLASADALARAGASPEEVRRTIERACDADADALEPWTALAAHLDEYGRPLEAARAHLAVSIRSEGPRAATSSLTAARLFHLAGRHEDAARAFRVANAAQVHCVPPALILAEQALARGDLDSASENLVLIDEEALPEAIRPTFRHALSLASGASHAEPTQAESVTELPPEPVPSSEELAAATTPAWPAEPLPAAEPPPPAAPSDPVASILREQADLADGPDRASLLERLAGHYQRSGLAGEAADALMEALLTDPSRQEGWQRLGELVELAPDRAARAAVLRARLLPQVEAAPVQETAATPEVTAVSEPAPEPSHVPEAVALPEPEAPAVAVRPPAVAAELAADAFSAPPAADPWAAPPVTGEEEPLDLGLASAEDLARQFSQPAEDIVLEPTPAPLPLPPTDRATQILTLVREHAAAGNRRALASISEEAEALLGVEVLRPFATSLGRAALDAGRAEVAYRWLMLAREDDPEELTISRDLSRAAERTGRHAEEVAFGEPCADAIAPHDPLAAAARFHHLAHVLADKVGDLAGAAAIMEKALALAPDDRAGRRQLWSLWGRLAEARPRALDAWLEAARTDPADVEALGQTADLAALLAVQAPPEQAARLDERARLATSLAAFVSHGRSAPASRLARSLPQEARDAMAAPGAGGPLGLLLGMLSPYLEPLFPADLQRRGVTASDRLVAPQAPQVRQALERAAALLEARPIVPFMVDKPGVELQLENTRPPALVVPAGVEALPAPVVEFLAVRTLDLLGRGWPLVGKFAPRDVAILLELACRFAGATPPSMGLPPERAKAFLDALARSVPPSIADRVRPLGPAAADELARIDVRAFTTALRSSGARVALLATGDANAALTGLQLLERTRPDRSAVAGPFQTMEQRELAELALSDPFLLLRASVLA